MSFTASRVALVLLSAAACGPSGKFVRTDSAFVVTARAQTPDWFGDQAPTRTYRAVGRIEVTLAETAQADEVKNAAIAKGRAVGCELLVALDLHKKLSAAEFDVGPDFEVVHDPPERSDPAAVTAEKTHAFICGVYGDAVPVHPA